MDMLSYKRPHGSDSEQQFIKKFIDSVPGMKQDGYGNRFIIVGDDKPIVMFSCHTDTVHKDGGKQSLMFDGNRLRLASCEVKGVGSNCLGADDGAGVWLLLELIKEKIPGMYVFHRCEERGGHGSSHIADKLPQLTSGLMACIAFDRMGKSSVITHQMIGRTCSQAFAKSIIRMLGISSLVPDDGGSFTDSANYTDVIGECTNISVGYDDEHRHIETLDVHYLFMLRDTMVAKWNQDELEYDREAGEVDEEMMWDSHKQDWCDRYDKLWRGSDGPSYEDDHDWAGSDSLSPHKDLERMVRDNPRATASLLRDWGIGTEELREYVAADTYVGRTARRVIDMRKWK